MKVIDIPKSGKCGGRVFYRLRRSQCWRKHVIPQNPRTAAQRRARKDFGLVSTAWSELLTETQRQAWVARGARVRSYPRLGQSGWLTGHMHFEGINTARARIGRGLLLWPPEPVVFGPNPVEDLIIRYEQGRMRLKLKVSGLVTEDIMVFGQPPCRAGWRKWRHGAYLGLLPAPENGESDVTEMYLAKYGEPTPGQKVFIRTRQQVNGWEGIDQDTSAVVAAKPVAASRIRTGVPTPRPAIHSRCQAGSRTCSREAGRSTGYIPFASPAVSVSCAVHKGVVPEQCWSRCLAVQGHGLRGRGHARDVGAVGRVGRASMLGEAARNGSWYELWHHG